MYALYSMYPVGSAEHDELRSLFPESFAVIDKLEGNA